MATAETVVRAMEALFDARTEVQRTNAKLHGRPDEENQNDEQLRARRSYAKKRNEMLRVLVQWKEDAP